jgi:hypothetical protein
MAWKKLSRSHTKSPLRYFIYVSDAKLEMLFDQIHADLRRRLSAEAKVDLKLASLSIKAAEEPAPTRMAKLKVVERYIDSNHDVGTIESPGFQYFRGTMAMRWGALLEDETARVVYFFGKRDGHAVFLGGSRNHVLGEPTVEAQGIGSNRSEFFGGSGYPTILRALENHVSALDPKAPRALARRRAGAFDDDDEALTRFGQYAEQERHEIHSVLYTALSDGEGLDGPEQWMEFLAVPLLSREVEANRVRPDPTFIVLGTPIYIAHADPPQPAP